MREGGSAPHTREGRAPAPPSPAVTIRSIVTILREDYSMNQRAFLYKRGKTLSFYCNKNRMHILCFFKTAKFCQIIAFLMCLNVARFSEWCIWKYEQRMFYYVIREWEGELPQVKKHFINWFSFFFLSTSHFRTIWSPLSLGRQLCGETKLQIFLYVYFISVFSDSLYICIRYHPRHPS